MFDISFIIPPTAVAARQTHLDAALAEPSPLTIYILPNPHGEGKLYNPVNNSFLTKYSGASNLRRYICACGVVR